MTELEPAAHVQQTMTVLTRFMSGKTRAIVANFDVQHASHDPGLKAHHSPLGLDADAVLDGIFDKRLNRKDCHRAV